MLRHRVVQLHEQIGLDQMTEIGVKNIQNILYPNASEFQQELARVFNRRDDSQNSYVKSKEKTANAIQNSRNVAEMGLPGTGTNSEMNYMASLESGASAIAAAHINEAELCEQYMVV